MRPDGSVGGLYLTGWTYRYFARHLQEARKHDLADALRDAGINGQMPIEYLGVFDKDGVYTAPLTPPVDEQALAALKLVERTATGQASGTLTLTDREFGWSAVRTPKLGPKQASSSCAASSDDRPAINCRPLGARMIVRPRDRPSARAVFARARSGERVKGRRRGRASRGRCTPRPPWARRWRENETGRGETGAGQHTGGG